MAVIHQRLQIKAIYQSIKGLPQNKATGHAPPRPRILAAVAETPLINNPDAFTAAGFLPRRTSKGETGSGKFPLCSP